MEECSCYLIDWTAENGKYIHIESGEIYDPQKHGALDCQTKVNEGTFTFGDYFANCKYIPGDSNSKFPSVYEKITNYENTKIQEGTPPIPEKLFQ